MSKALKVFKKNYVGINYGRKCPESGLPLAFLAPYEDNAAGRKRQDTVDQWTKGWYGNSNAKNTTRIEDNVGQIGFKISDWESRHRTNNKFARLACPNGYELEISMENLIYLLKNTVVSHGVFDDELVWARDGGNNYLIPLDSAEYKNALHQGTKLKVTPGGIIHASTGGRYIYLGRGYRQVTGIVGPFKQIDDKSWRGYKRYEMDPDKVAVFNDDDLYHLYIGLDGTKKSDYLTLRKSKMKAARVEDKKSTFKLNDDMVFKMDSYSYTHMVRFNSAGEVSTTNDYDRVAGYNKSVYINTCRARLDKKWEDGEVMDFGILKTKLKNIDARSM